MFSFFCYADGIFCPEINVPDGSFEITKYLFPGVPQGLAVKCNGYSKTFEVVCKDGSWEGLSSCIGNLPRKKKIAFLSKCLYSVSKRSVDLNKPGDFCVFDG